MNRAIRGEVVQHHNWHARFLERQHGMATNVPGTSGNQNGMSTSHGFLRSLGRSDRVAEHLDRVRAAFPDADEEALRATLEGMTSVTDSLADRLRFSLEDQTFASALRSAPPLARPSRPARAASRVDGSGADGSCRAAARPRLLGSNDHANILGHGPRLAQRSRFVTLLSASRHQVVAEVDPNRWTAWRRLLGGIR